MVFKKVLVLLCVPAALLLAGCGGLTYKISKPTVSRWKYADVQDQKIVIRIVDKRVGNDTVFAKPFPSAIPVKIKLEKLGDPISFLAQNLEKELCARNIPVSCVTSPDQKADLTLDVERFQIINRRSGGFAPWESFHVFKGSVTNANGTFPFHAFFFNGKVPMWSMDEVETPCINMPLSIMIKEIATKINRLAIGAKVGDNGVALLSEHIRVNIGMEDNGPFWKVFELGATNNPAAIEPLKEFCNAKDNFFRACALSAIGNLGPKGQIPFLKKELGETSEISKFMVLKSIGDLETEQSRAFLEGMAKSSSEDGITICKELYTK